MEEFSMMLEDEKINQISSLGLHKLVFHGDVSFQNQLLFSVSDEFGHEKSQGRSLAR